MGLFGSGVLRKQIDELAVQLESMRRELETVKSERSDLKKELSAQEALVDRQRKAEKRLRKNSSASPLHAHQPTKKLPVTRIRLDTLKRNLRRIAKN